MESADFLDILKQRGQWPPATEVPLPASSTGEAAEGTTILAVRFAEGVLVAGDRRATAGHTVIHDRADKLLSVDDRSVLALSGSPASAWEMARMLEISFQHYRRTQLQELSLDGRLRTLSRLLRENLPMALQGIGAVVPIYATCEETGSGPEGKIFFYDVLGATFESVDFCTTGSGSPSIRGSLYYLNRWERPFAERSGGEALRLVVKMLETAAEYDTATGGFRAGAAVYPQVMRVTGDGVSAVAEAELARVYASLDG